jgi:CRP/FNR family cyclic AMP-dependent transcriptional regulator
VVENMWENIFKSKDKAKTVQSILSENILFKDLTRRELRFVENIVHERHYQPQEPIFKQGELGVGMYIIVKGAVEVFVSDPKKTTVNETLVTRLVERDFFGETSLVEDNGRRTATAMAVEETTLIGFFKADLIEILERNPSTGVKIVFNLASAIGQRLKETTEKITALKASIKILNDHHSKESQGVE